MTREYTEHMLTPPQIVAIVPAAGRSRRMGRCKPLIEIDGEPMLLRLVRILGEGGTSRRLVVVSRRVAEAIGRRLRATGADVLLNDDPRSEMIDSIRIGLRAVSVSGPRAADGVLITPADMPRITADDVRACVDAFARDPQQMVVATHGGRRGHPLIVPAAWAPELRSPALDRGLRELLRLRADRLREATCPTPGVLHDADRPEDLAGDAGRVL